MKPIRTIVVDDEPPARRRIRDLLRSQADIEVLAECQSGAEAVRAIRERSPQLMFLDIQMPGMDGFGVLRALSPSHAPFTIFITAYDSHAIEAFEVNALDYLLKPFSDERFEAALQRARERLQAKSVDSLNERVTALLKTIQNNSGEILPDNEREGGQTGLDRLAIKADKRVFFLKAREIDWIKAAGVYVKIHTRGTTHLHRETLSNLEHQLGPEQFVRIHRSTIVNIDRIAELQPYSHGEYCVVLQDGTRLRLSRSYRARLQLRLRQDF